MGFQSNSGSTRVNEPIKQKQIFLEILVDPEVVKEGEKKEEEKQMMRRGESEKARKLEKRKKGKENRKREREK